MSLTFNRVCRISKSIWTSSQIKPRSRKKWSRSRQSLSRIMLMRLRMMATQVALRLKKRSQSVNLTAKAPKKRRSKTHPTSWTSQKRCCQIKSPSSCLPRWKIRHRSTTIRTLQWSLVTSPGRQRALTAPTCRARTIPLAPRERNSKRKRSISMTALSWWRCITRMTSTPKSWT